jgi:hypothetical protein
MQCNGCEYQKECEHEKNIGYWRSLAGEPNPNHIAGVGKMVEPGMPTRIGKADYKTPPKAEKLIGA